MLKKFNEHKRYRKKMVFYWHSDFIQIFSMYFDSEMQAMINKILNNISKHMVLFSHIEGAKCRSYVDIFMTAIVL